MDHHESKEKANLKPTVNSSELLAIYEGLRDLFPAASFPVQFQRQDDLSQLSQRFDAFFFDAFGVLNIGETAIEGAVERIQSLRQQGRHVRVVSNAGGTPKQGLVDKYTRLGFDFSAEEIICSRDALNYYLKKEPPGYWGAIAPPGAPTDDLRGEFINLAERPEAVDEVDGIVLLSTIDYDHSLTERLIASLTARPRIVLLGNPDLAAPREDHFSLEPGYVAQQLIKAVNMPLHAFGKPYKSVFQLALDSLPEDIYPDQVLMIGDTLHTDILGGRFAGLETALVVGQGFSSTLDWQQAIQETGLVPHYVIDHI